MLILNVSTFLGALLILEYVVDSTTSNYDDTKTSYHSNQEDFENLAFQLENVRCPAKAGLELRDYWRCLWKSSVPSSGDERVPEMIFDEDEKSYSRSRSPFPRKTSKKQEKVLSRTKRSTKSINESYVVYYRVYNSSLDIHESMEDYKNVRKCQSLYVFPGANFRKYFNCLRDSKDRRAAKFIAALEEDYQVNFNPREFDNRKEECLTKTRNSEDVPEYCVKLQFLLDPIEEEDKVTNFEGADPYLDEQYSRFLYKYNNLNNRQRQPAWSYNGLDGTIIALPSANQWHNLNLKKFYLPLRETVNDEALDDLELKSDFPQTYPGIGEIVGELMFESAEAKTVGLLDAPLSYRWTKDRGYHAYTRYLIPMLDKDDLAYYKYKEYLPPNVERPNEVDVIAEIVTTLTKFKEKIGDTLVSSGAVADFLYWQPNSAFPKEESIPFFRVYREFFQHYYLADVGVYRDAKVKEYSRKNITKTIDDVHLHNEFEIIRKVLISYLQAVIEQMKCLVVILEDSTVRKDEKTTMEFLKTVENSTNCSVLPRREAMALNDSVNSQMNLQENYFVPNDTLKVIYNSYFTRKESRKRYTLPRTPEQFPICRHNEPSPIDIITVGKDRKSSLKSYELGAAAYKLNRFFIMFPIDGSHLLTVGIVDGERLDGSSVLLKGGAIKGQNLTFQYMFIRFGKDAKSEGSEHRIDGKPGQMELQLLFTISGSADPIKYWQILARIQNQMFQSREKLMVILSVLVDVAIDDKDLETKIKNEKTDQDPHLFEPFAHAAYYFRKNVEEHPDGEHPRGYVTRDPVMRLIEFLPKSIEKDDNAKFYTYRGSLSWPPCFGYVLWSVFHKRLFISKRQFDEFAKIPAFGTSDNNRVANNFRRPKDAYVEEEKSVRDYNTVQKMIKRRTIDRYILEGRYEKTNVEQARTSAGVVEEEIYYLTDEDQISRATSMKVTYELQITFLLIIFRILL